MSKERAASKICTIRVPVEKVTPATIARRREVVSAILRTRDAIGPLKKFSVSRVIRSMREGKASR